MGGALPPVESRVTDAWHVYILECADNTLYTGIARDLDDRDSSDAVDIDSHRLTSPSNFFTNWMTSRPPGRVEYATSSIVCSMM